MLQILTPSAHRLTSYGDNDVLLILEKLYEAGKSGKIMGRSDLSRTTGIGEGIIRSILQRLKPMGFVEVSHAGVYLGESGRAFLDAAGFVPMDLEHTDSAIGVYQVPLIVKGKAHLIIKGVEQRDSGLKAGGDGCTTIICRNGELVLPPDWSIDGNSPGMATRIRSYGISDGDVVLIGGSNTGIREAAAAANSAAMALVNLDYSVQ